ncbi:hypothetical protein GUJ93_ZPchr0007g3161 [Zizania palustris]|uniref:Uncharacterized protein n=1 Tax=Zizania palustris TaxID=103762 RepID=A0A8J5VSD2_ZIZPA|nr:hypothetical protein GUJ93_ZPchr0007g3161 [Zizania palustris]
MSKAMEVVPVLCNLLQSSVDKMICHMRVYGDYEFGFFFLKSLSKFLQVEAFAKFSKAIGKEGCLGIEFFSTNKARAQLAALGLFSRGGPASPRLPHRSAACSIPPPAWEPGCPSPAWELQPHTSSPAWERRPPGTSPPHRPRRRPTTRSRSAACSIPPPAWEPGCPSPAWEANDQDTGAQETDDQEPLHAMLSSPPAVGAQDSKLG